MYCNRISTQGDANEFCEHIFDTYDTTRDGIIDFCEFMTSLIVMSRGTATEKLESTFRMYDLDGAGFVSETELLHLLTVCIHIS